MTTHNRTINPREITGWAMYDWANSAFSVVVVTTFLGPYLTSLINAQGGILNVAGYEIRAAAFYPFCVSISVLLQVILLPILGTLADYTNLKKNLLLLFAYLGATATILLFFIQSNSILLGGLLFIIANLSFGGAVVFYNAFLPDIAPPEKQDAVSSTGFAYGYVGGGLLLFLNLILVFLMTESDLLRGFCQANTWFCPIYDAFPKDSQLAIRISLASAGLWWLIFTFLYPHQRLIQRAPADTLPPGTNYISYSFKEFAASLREMKNKYPRTLQFLIAYLIYNDGIQTVVSVATIFASDELGLGPDTLVGVILMIQFVAAFGAILFNKLAERIGAKYTVIITLIGWMGLIIYAYGFMYDTSQVWLWSFIQALVLGSSQALSRSMFAKMIPAKREAAYFSLYEISERGTSWVGPIVFAWAVQLTGSARISMLPIIAFFVIGMIILYFTDVRRAVEEAGNEVPAIV